MQDETTNNFISISGDVLCTNSYSIIGIFPEFYKIDSSKIKTIEDIIAVLEVLQTKPIQHGTHGFEKAKHLLTKIE